MTLTHPALNSLLTRDYGKRCAAWDGNNADTPGNQCKARVVIRRRSGEYTVPVCADHATGHALYRLGTQYFGWSK